MGDIFNRGVNYFSGNDFASAEDCFLEAIRAGDDKIACLFNYSVCCFLRTIYQMDGTGRIGGMSRRGNLVMVQKSLREVYAIDPTHFQAVRYLVLCSYAIGKLMPSRNGYTADFYKYEEQLKDCDLGLYHELLGDIEGIDSQF